MPGQEKKEEKSLAELMKEKRLATEKAIEGKQPPPSKEEAKVP